MVFSRIRLAVSVLCVWIFITNLSVLYHQRNSQVRTPISMVLQRLPLPKVTIDERQFGRGITGEKVLRGHIILENVHMLLKPDTLYYYSSTEEFVNRTLLFPSKLGGESKATLDIGRTEQPPVCGRIISETVIIFHKRYSNYWHTISEGIFPLYTAFVSLGLSDMLDSNSSSRGVIISYFKSDIHDSQFSNMYNTFRTPIVPFDQLFTPNVCFKRVVLLGFNDFTSELSTQHSQLLQGFRTFMRKTIPYAQNEPLPFIAEELIHSIGDSTVATHRAGTIHDTFTAQAHNMTCPPVISIVKRVHTRKILNLNELVSELSLLGSVSIVTFNVSQPYTEQMSLLRNSDLVVGIHGAGLTNIIWCSPYPRLLQLMPYGWNDGHRHQRIYENFSKSLGGRFESWVNRNRSASFLSYRNGKSRNPNYNELPKKSYYIPEAWKNQNTIVNVTEVKQLALNLLYGDSPASNCES